MRFQYFKPRSDICQLASSYYLVDFEEESADLMRAEIANIRFVLNGCITSDINGQDERFPAGSTMLCGPTFGWSNVRFSAGTRVFGAAITPLGWARLFGSDASELAHQIVPLEPHVAPSWQDRIARVFAGRDGPEVVAASDDLLLGMIDPARRIDEPFLHQVTEWITSPEPNELSVLLSGMDRSHRQIDRLSRRYFGSAPKLLHRKFRALHSANRLVWNDLTDWQDIATTVYCDQSHFIREFKQFNGRTPTEFINNTRILVRMTLEQRLQIDHASPFSLIG